MVTKHSMDKKIGDVQKQSPFTKGKVSDPKVSTMNIDTLS